MRLSVAVLAVLLLAGCGGLHSRPRGERVFDRACAGCHTLTGHDTSAPGGDLAVARLGAGDLESFAAQMPVDPPLSRDDLRAVAQYVHGKERR